MPLTPHALHHRIKSSTVTNRVDAKLDRELKRLSRSPGQTKSDIARDARKRQVALLRLRKKPAKRFFLRSKPRPVFSPTKMFLPSCREALPRYERACQCIYCPSRIVRGAARTNLTVTDPAAPMTCKFVTYKFPARTKNAAHPTATVRAPRPSLRRTPGVSLVSLVARTRISLS